MKQGTVSNLIDTNYKGTQLWSFQLQGDNTYYRTGQVRPACDVGSFITFEMKNLEKNQVDVASIQIIPNAASQGKSDSNTKNRPAGGPSGNFMDDRQKSIIYQSSRKDAIETVKILIGNNLVQKDDYDTSCVMKLVDNITKKYINDVTDLTPVDWDDFVMMELE